MENLSTFEIEILNRFSKKYAFLETHLPLLSVNHREYTGVGLYINFIYTQDVERLPLDHASLGTDEILCVEGLKNGLIFELDISEGKINFIEFVSIGEEWDGHFLNYSFEAYD